MKTIYCYTCYKKYIQDRIYALPSRGRGEFKKISQFLKVHSTMVSHIFKGDLHLNLEQAIALTEYFAMNMNEAEYFECLVHLGKAGSTKAKDFIQRRLFRLQQEAMKVSRVVTKRVELSEEDKAIYYSDWSYSAVRLLLFSLKNLSLKEIASRLRIAEDTVAKIIHFLESSNLIRLEKGVVTPLIASTHISDQHPLHVRHHKNWREKVTECLGRRDDKDNSLHYSSPVMMGEKDLMKVKACLLSTIKQTDKIFDDSGSEVLYCLNIDWFKVEN